MKHLPLFILLVLLVGGAYVRLDRPQQWNALLTAARAPEPQSSAAPSDSSTNTMAVATPPPVTPPPAPVPAPAAAPVPAPASLPVSSPVATVQPAVDPATIAAAPSPAPLPPAAKVWSAPDPLPAQANWTWTTGKGVVYTNVVVKRVSPDTVTILDDSGGAQVAIADLPSDIQKLLNYDPITAAGAGAERARQEAADAEAIAQEKQKYEQARLDRGKEQAATDAAAAATPVALTEGQKALYQQQIVDLRKDINQKLRQIASSYGTGNYSHAVSSQSAYRDAVMDEAQQINELEGKLGLPQSSIPVFYPTYPYYYYPYY